MTDAFATRAAQWDAHPVRAAIGQAFYAQVLEATASHLAGALEGKTVLDFGCGTGTLGLRLAQEHAARVIFADASAAMLDVLRGKLAGLDLPDAQIFEGGINALPLADASADLAVSLMALHHIEDAEGALRGLRKALKPGGLLLLGDLLPEDGSFHDASPDGPTAAHNGFDPEALRVLCHNLGLAVLRLLPFHLVRKPDAAGAVREYPLFFLAAKAV